jgi:hypothetical protein
MWHFRDQGYLRSNKIVGAKGRGSTVRPVKLGKAFVKKSQTLMTSVLHAGAAESG